MARTWSTQSRGVAIGVALILVLAACSSPSTSGAPASGAPAASASGGAVVPSGSATASGAVGGSLTLWTAWGGKELETFKKVLQPFTDQTGVEVKITTVRDAAQLAINVEAGTTLPDIAGAPTADKIPTWAQNGTMKALEDYLTDFNKYKDETLPGLVNGGTEVGVVDGKHYLMFVKTQIKNLFWYNSKVFTGTAPKTWDEMLKVQTPDGAKLFCAGIESGADSGWPATDNIEGILMRQSGDQVYNDWWAGKHKWSSPEVKQAFQTYGEIVSEKNVYGGPNAVLTTAFQRAGKPLFAAKPGCVLYDQATFIPNFFLEDYPNLKPVDDFNFIEPPSFNSQFDGLQEFFFDNFVMYNDTPQSRALMNYMWTADAQQIFVDAGGTLAANKNISKFPDPVFQHASEVVKGAEKLLVDGSDNMPAEMRTAFYKGILNFVKNQDQIDSILADLDEVQAGAYTQ